MGEERYLNNTNIRIWKKNADQFIYLKSIDESDFYFLSYEMGYGCKYFWICRYENNNDLSDAIEINMPSMKIIRTDIDSHSNNKYYVHSKYMNQYLEMLELTKKYLILI